MSINKLFISSGGKPKSLSIHTIIFPLHKLTPSAKAEANPFFSILWTSVILFLFRFFIIPLVPSMLSSSTIYDYKNKVVGCIHAGWRGAISGIIKNTVSKIKKIIDNGNNKRKL